MTSSGAIPERQPETDETVHFRSHMGRVSRQSSVFLAGTLFSAAAAYLFKVYLARVLGAEALGIYALGMTVVGFVTMFSSLGLPRTALRFVSAYSATGKQELLRGFLVRSLSVLLVSNLVLGAVMYVAGPWVAVHFYHAPKLVPYLGLFVLIMLLGVLTSFFGQALGGYKGVTRRTVINNFIGTPVLIAGSAALIVLGFGLRGYIVAQLGCAALTLILYVVSVWKLTPRAADFSVWTAPPLEKEVVAFSAMAMGLAFMDFFAIQTDRVMIGHYLDARALGIYAAARSLVAYLAIILSSVNQIFAPTISGLHARDQRKLLGRMYQTLTKWIFAFTVPLAAVLIVFAAPLMRIFGKEFEIGWPVLAIGAIGQLVNCGVGSAGTLLLMSGNQKSLMWVGAGSAVITVVLNWLLIPHFGIVGAAVASAVTLVVTNMAYLNRVRLKLGLSPYNGSYLRLIFPLCSSLGAIWLAKLALPAMRREWLGILTGVVLAYAALVGTALAAGLDSDDRVIIRAVWSRLSSAFPGTEADS